MCLNTFSTRILTTNKDIICYKAGFSPVIQSANYYHVDKTYFETLFRYYRYPFNAIITVVEELNICLGVGSYLDNISKNYYENPYNKHKHDIYKPIYSVSSGCHSSLTIKRLIDYLICYPSGFVAKCIIPSKSQIVKDATGLIVSNKIIITKQIYRYAYNKKFTKNNLNYEKVHFKQKIKCS